MNIEDLLLQRRSAILEKWLEAILKTYPEDTAKFLKQQKNRFANPVGTTFSQEIESLFDQLVKGIEKDNISRFLENVIRIRAVQNFRPAEAIAFVFQVKGIVRSELEKEIEKNRLWQELLAFESRIDELALLAFDLYLQCREKIYEIRSLELKNRTYRLLKRANVLHEITEEQWDITGRKADTLNEAR